MNCHEIKNYLAEHPGESIIDGPVKEHLKHCADCSLYYADLTVMAENLKTDLEPLTNSEFALIESRLDRKIDHYQKRAVRFYTMATRYGASLAAVFLLFFVSFYSRIGDKTGSPTAVNVESGRSFSGDSAYIAAGSDSSDFDFLNSSQASDSASLDDQYLYLVIRNYIQAYGLSAGDQLVGNLSDEEWNYLNNKIAIKDIL